MEYIPLKLFIVGALAVAGALVVAELEERLPTQKNKKYIETLQQSFLVVFLICASGFVLLFLWDLINQPSSYEICMEKARGFTDPKAISYMEDYCYTNR
jgi:hypothetical protein